MLSLFVSKRIFLGDDDAFINGGVAVNKDGKIERVLTSSSQVDAFKVQNNVAEIFDFGTKILMPGLIDCHVHVNEPGRTAWEGFETATKAAAAGGFTTIVDMPLNSIPPTTTVDNLNAKIKAAENKLYVDVILWGGIIPGNLCELPKLIENGIRGFKCFLCPSGTDEFPYVNKDQVESALNNLENTGSMLAFHAELQASQMMVTDDSHPEKYITYLKTRPQSMEIAAISLISELAQKYKNTRLHIVHLSSADAVPIIQDCRTNGGNLTVETCHHYLTLNAENIPDYSTEYKCTPPIREKANQAKLWEAVRNGTIDLLASDHSPCTPDLKLPGQGEGQGNFLKAWGGISSNQFGLSLFWSNCQKYGLGVKDVVKLMCRNPAKHCGFATRKGSISAGFDADFCVWDPDEEYVVTADIIQFKNKITPYMNRTLRGVVYATILRGNVVYRTCTDFQKPKGKLLLHTN